MKRIQIPNTGINTVKISPLLSNYRHCRHDTKMIESPYESFNIHLLNCSANVFMAAYIFKEYKVNFAINHYSIPLKILVEEFQDGGVHQPRPQGGVGAPEE